MQEAILYLRGRDPICPAYRPRWWPHPSTSPQLRPPLVGAWFEGRRIGAASLAPWQMRRNLFGRDVTAAAGAAAAAAAAAAVAVAGEESRVRADGTRVPAMMVLPLEAVRRR